MASKIRKMENAPHTSGIFADMTVDGPLIGTLVVIVDRAKNLPNRRTMGKQDPYCACRLGKHSKKTNTDKRGGQVPRWDQELRFDTHDSPDYYQLKVSVFNDDKKTELIGETWVSLTEVIVPGGGQSDIWHSLNCKGKYAGEIRLELTYYDTRPKPEEPVTESLRDSSRAGAEDGQSPSLNGPRSTPVKRRPLPSNPGSASASPAEGRPLPPTSGPRGYGTPPRQLSHPQSQSRSAGHTPSSQRRTVYNNNEPQPSERRRPIPVEHNYPETPDDPFYQEPNYRSHSSQQSYQAYSNYDPSDESRSQTSFSHQPYESDPLTGLPELPPMTSNRRGQVSRSSYSPSVHAAQDIYPPQPPELPHSQSAPVVPAQHPYPEDIPEQRLPLHHSQSDSFVHRPQPVRRPLPGPMEPIYDHHSDPAQQYQEEPYHHADQYAVAPHTNHSYNDYNQDERPQEYHDPHQQWALQPSMEDEPEPSPPPPPVHRDSAPNSAQRQIQSLPHDYRPDFAPAPLNIGAARESNSRMLMYQKPETGYVSPHQYNEAPTDYGGRRYTDPLAASPQQEQPIYRPRALSGDAIQRSSPQEDPFSRSTGHSSYSPPAQSPPHQPFYPDHRNSLPRQQELHSPTDRSPLAIESPHSLRDTGSGSQSQPHTPSLVVRYNQKQISPVKRSTPQRPYPSHHHSASEPYQPNQAYQTPPRPHPLAQEVPVAIGPSPQQYGTPQSQGQIVMAHSDPRQTRPAARSSVSSVTRRKSVSPRPPSSEQRSSVPFGPDSFDQFNPAANRSSSSLLNHPATSTPGTPLKTPPAGSQGSPYNKDGTKILDWHGNEIDPSDRLPETSWAPEPEPKGKVKDKPTREREKLNGARGPGGSASSRTSVGRLSMLPGSGNASPLSGGPSTPIESPTANAGVVTRNRLQKRGGPTGRPQSMGSIPSSAHGQPFKDIPNPPAVGGAMSPGGYGGARGSFSGNGAPPIPAKVPLGDGFGNEDFDALSHEMKSIDIGGPPSGGRRVGRGRMLEYR